jgi:sulfatase maturation enzyme AslB (radical SAM superfamily)
MTAVPDKFIEIWKKFRKVRIHLSIDDLEERNDYIRYGSKWEQILESFKKIIQYKDIFNLEVCQTVSAYNVFNIDNFKKFTLDYGLVISHNYVHYPSFQHINVIPDEMKNEILNNIKYMREDEVERLKIEMFKPKNNKDEEKFYEFVKLLDTSRNVKITDYLDEWKKYFE